MENLAEMLPPPKEEKETTVTIPRPAMLKDFA